MIGQFSVLTPGIVPDLEVQTGEPITPPADPAKAISFLLSTPVIAVVVIWLLWKWAND